LAVWLRPNQEMNFAKALTIGLIGLQISATCATMK